MRAVFSLDLGRKLHGMVGGFLMIVWIVVGAAPDASAVCCKRKGNFGCCGNGPCNIFCCNCDRGCNKQCEDTHCDTGEWFKCAGICTACAAACVVTEGEACVECMGPLYNTCKKCYSSSKALKQASPSLKAAGKGAGSRDAFFKSLAGSDKAPKTISPSDFSAFVEKESKRTKKKTSKDAIKKMFKAFDQDNNGVIDRKEFDADVDARL